MLRKLFKERRWHSLFIEMQKNIENPEIDGIINDLLLIAPRIYPVELVIILVLYTNKLNSNDAIKFLENAINKLHESVIFTSDHSEAELFLYLHKLLFELSIRDIESEIYELMNRKMNENCKFVYSLLCRRYFESIGDYDKALPFARDEYYIIVDSLLADNIYDFENIYYKYRLDEFRLLMNANESVIKENESIKDDSGIKGGEEFNKEINREELNKDVIINKEMKSRLGIDLLKKESIPVNDLYGNSKHLIKIYFDEPDRSIPINNLRILFDLVRKGDLNELKKINLPLPAALILRKATMVNILKKAQYSRKVDIESLGIDLESVLENVLDLLGSGIIEGFIDGRTLIIKKVNENILDLEEIKKRFVEWKNKISDTLSICGMK